MYQVRSAKRKPPVSNFNVFFYCSSKVFFSIYKSVMIARYMHHNTATIIMPIMSIKTNGFTRFSIFRISRFCFFHF